MIELVISLLITAIVVIAILYIISIWIYKRAPSNMGFIRTGFLGTKVCLGRGAIVLPVFHEVSWVSLETIKLIVSRWREQAVLTSDKIRIDIVMELYAHVGRTEDDLLTASRSLGEKTFDADQVRSLLEAKVISAMRSYAATKTLSELHENRETFASEIKSAVIASFLANGLVLEEVTIVSLEQTGKEYFKTDNVFDAEGLKIITEITSDAKRKVHDTEKRTNVAIKQKDLDTQLELLEIERQEAFARANQDRAVSNEQAQQLGEKQVYVLDQRRSVEQKEIEIEVDLERMRTERDIAITDEARRRESSDLKKILELEKERRDNEIAIIEKAKQEELADVDRKLELEKAEKDRQIEMIAKTKEEEIADIQRALERERAEKDREIELAQKERQRQEAEIQRVTEVMRAEEAARDERHNLAEETSRSMRARNLETKLKVLAIDKDESIASAEQELEVAKERARLLAEQQQEILERRLQVEREEINTSLAVEKARIHKDASVLEETKTREAADIRRQLAREQEERDREIALVAKAEELETAEIRRQSSREREDRDRQIALVSKEEELKKAEIQQALEVERAEKQREIELIETEKERERADIQRFLARELEERQREIAVTEKTKELEATEAVRLQAAREMEQAAHELESVRIVADAEREKELERIASEKIAQAKKIEEENKADITRMHMVTQAEAREMAAGHESKATVIRAEASSNAQKITAEGIEREAGARGRAEMEVETLRITNTRHLLEAEAGGIEAKADALKKYNEAATFLELAKMQIEADRDVHIDQAKAMGNALSQAQIRMYGGGDGTVDTIRGMFTQGFALGEVLEGAAQSLPEGLRQRFASNGIRGIFGRPFGKNQWKAATEHLAEMVDATMKSAKAKQIPFTEAVTLLEGNAGDDKVKNDTLDLLKGVNEDGVFDGVPFDAVWSLLQSIAKSAD